jgi:hypothetical protein
MQHCHLSSKQLSVHILNVDNLMDTENEGTPPGNDIRVHCSTHVPACMVQLIMSCTIRRDSGQCDIVILVIVRKEEY